MKRSKEELRERVREKIKRWNEWLNDFLSNFITENEAREITEEDRNFLRLCLTKHREVEEMYRQQLKGLW